jgi:predicted  nucleic acid-binding Zn-ribbon protein
MPSTHELSKLWQLQQLDLKLDKLQDRLNQPHYLAKFNSAQVPARVALQELKQNEQRLKELKKAIRQGEQELDNLQSQITTAEATLYGGKGVSAKELLAVERRIKLLREQHDQLEETMLESMLQYESLQADTVKVKLHAEEVVAIYRDAKRMLESEVAELNAEIAKMTQQRQAITGQIQTEWLMRYTKARERYPDAVAQIDDTVCGACRVQVPGGLKNQAKAGERTYCESCGRLLFVAE